MFVAGLNIAQHYPETTNTALIKQEHGLSWFTRSLVNKINLFNKNETRYELRRGAGFLLKNSQLLLNINQNDLAKYFWLWLTMWHQVTTILHTMVTRPKNGQPRLSLNNYGNMPVMTPEMVIIILAFHFTSHLQAFPPLYTSLFPKNKCHCFIVVSYSMTDENISKCKVPNTGTSL